VYTVGLSTLLSRRFVVPETSSQLYFIFFGLFLTWWVIIDARVRRTGVPYDFGYLVWFTWPISVTYYIVQTRGWKGGLFVLGLFGLWIAPIIFAAFAAALSLKQLLASMGIFGFYFPMGDSEMDLCPVTHPGNHE